MPLHDPLWAVTGHNGHGLQVVRMLWSLCSMLVNCQTCKKRIQMFKKNRNLWKLNLFLIITCWHDEILAIVLQKNVNEHYKRCQWEFENYSRLSNFKKTQHVNFKTIHQVQFIIMNRELYCNYLKTTCHTSASRKVSPVAKKQSWVWRSREKKARWEYFYSHGDACITLPVYTLLPFCTEEVSITNVFIHSCACTAPQLLSYAQTERTSVGHSASASLPSSLLSWSLLNHLPNQIIIFVSSYSLG